MHRPGIIGGRPHHGGGGYVGPLDIVSGAVVAYSQRAMSAAWASNAITIRRDSDDTTMSFATTASNAVDTAAVGSFLGGANGFGAAWLDQSGHGNDLVQATKPNQPGWLSSVQNARPGLTFDGTQFLGTAGNPTIPADTTIFLVFKFSSGDVFGVNWQDVAGPDGPDLRFNTSSDNVLLNADSLNFDDSYSFGGGSVAQDVYVLVDVAGGNASFTGFVNGTALSGANFPSAGAITVSGLPLAVGASDLAATVAMPSGLFIGGLVEILLYPIINDANRLAVRQNIATYYGITLP